MGIIESGIFVVVKAGKSTGLVLRTELYPKKFQPAISFLLVCILVCRALCPNFLL